MPDIGETGDQQAFVPSAPTDVVEAPDTGGTSGTIYINWTEPNNDGGSTILSYNVYITVNGVQSLAASGISLTTATLTGLTNGSSYTFQVAAVNSIGEGAYSAPSASIVPFGAGGGVPCFPKGTPILTPSGYKAVETLEQGSFVLTADGRPVPLKLYGRLLSTTTERSAPYFIPKGALGLNMPRTDLTLSPDHAFLLRKGVWMLPKTAAALSTKVQQLGLGEPVHYYHVECPNYLRDNLVVNGATVESYAGKQLNFMCPYAWSDSLKGYTRVGETKAAKMITARK